MDITPFTNKINLIAGTIVAVLSYFLGDFWFIFAAFLILNIIDYVTGCLKSRINGKTNSAKGAIGILKKLGYWLMILISFLMPAIFIELGEAIGMDLGFSYVLSYFTLATLIINEFRSILENFVEMGYHPPAILVKGLEVANKAIDGMIKISDNGIETILNKSEEEIQKKGKVTMGVEDIRAISSEGTPLKKE